MAKAKRNKEKPQAPPMGFIRFESQDPFYSVAVRLGDGDIKPTFATGWERQPRPQKKSITWWNGGDGFELSIPILFDHHISGDGITCEAEIRQLEAMAGQEKDVDEPPIIAFNSGGLVPHDEHDASHLDWIISSIDWGKAIRSKNGNRTRQEATVVLWEFVEDQELNDDSAAKKNKHRKKSKKSKGARHKTHHVQPGETLSTIARDELGNASRWRDIAKKNPKHGKARRDPKSVKPGETLKMP
jgi:LysM repeat protein